MIVIHGASLLPHLVGAALTERLPAMPVVVVTGARQSGKSTLPRRSCRATDDLERARGSSGAAADRRSSLPRPRQSGARSWMAEHAPSAARLVDCDPLQRQPEILLDHERFGASNAPA